MAYIGNPIVSTDFPVDYKNGDGSTTAFTLTVAPASVNAIDVQVSGVSQSPQTYSVSGTTLTFSAAPPTGTNNIVVRHKGVAGIPNTPSVGSVQTAQLGNITNIASSTSLTLQTGSTPTTAITVDASQFVGIGNSVASTINTANGTGRLVIGTGTGDSGLTIYTGATSIGGISFANGTTGTNTYRGYLSYNNASDYMSFWTAATERMRLDSSGRLLMGCTSTPSSTVGGVLLGNQATAEALISSTGSYTGGSDRCLFVNGNGTVGKISVSGSTTTYSTSSDYRLKENVSPMVNALGRISALNPVTYTWKADGSHGEGFIAHELQEVCPDAVIGEKDAVNEDGTIKAQSIDTSFLIATLTAAIQELKAELDATKAEVAALKAGV